MPSGERYRVTALGRKVDLSPAQFALLKRATIKINGKATHNFLQMVTGLRKQGLLIKRDGQFVRTSLAQEVLAIIKGRIKRVSNKSKEQ